MKRNQNDSPSPNKKRVRLNDNVSAVLAESTNNKIMNGNSELLKRDIYESKIGGRFKIPAPNSRGLPRILSKTESLNCNNPGDGKSGKNRLSEFLKNDKSLDESISTMSLSPVVKKIKMREPRNLNYDLMPKLGSVPNSKVISTENTDSKKQETPSLDQELFGLYASICENESGARNSLKKDSENKKLQPLNLNK